MDAQPGHEFQPPTPEDSRSPCPALNAAANHGYLPHSGKNLTFLQLTKVVHKLYGLSYPLAAALALGGILLCGSRGKINLDQLSKHNKIEHDASLAHQDVREGDNKVISPKLVEELVADSSDGQGLSLNDFARARVRREGQSPVPLDKLHTRIAQGESVLSVMVMGDGQQMPCEAVKTWYGEDRLPAGWAPQRTLGLLKLFGLTRSFSRVIDDIRQGEKHAAAQPAT
ncbi:hypothetical protein CTheo_3945 [Ceratobasidium theobromae]|uniref:Heme haloperoxidase family profile domain-containing protein n=1 Tax=Ceratobasidium theobromae TaxID=1582974 RepID=A0A5N5QLS1_9AGAM|nr:hypothetical protein CTheo_3945 [Ceratobasidium theobromae]